PRVVQGWMGKDSKPVDGQVQDWVQEQWARQELGADALIPRLQVGCLRALGKPPEKAFDDALEALAERQAAPDASPPGGQVARPAGRRGGAAAEPGLEEGAETLGQLEQLVGRPQDDASADTPATLAAGVREAGDKLTEEWGQKLAELPVHLIEDPGCRLAGAEEAVRQVVATIEQILRHHEPLARDLATRTQEAYARVRAW